MAEPLRGYYAILDAGPDDLRDHAAIAHRATLLLAAAPCALQLRAKGGRAADLVQAAGRLGAQCREAGVLFCVNDRLDVAVAVAADLVHLGQDDLQLGDARRVLAAHSRGQRILIGISTHNAEQAEAAVRGGADYIGVGPIFGTTTKTNPCPVLGVEALAGICRAVRVPVVAIGGITPETAPRVAAAGAAAAAVIAAVERSGDPTAAGRAVRDAFAR